MLKQKPMRNADVGIIDHWWVRGWPMLLQISAIGISIELSVMFSSWLFASNCPWETMMSCTNFKMGRYSRNFPRSVFMTRQVWTNGALPVEGPTMKSLSKEVTSRLLVIKYLMTYFQHEMAGTSSAKPLSSASDGGVSIAAADFVLVGSANGEPSSSTVFMLCS